MDVICACGCEQVIPPSTYGSRRKDGTRYTRQSGARFLRGHHLKVERPPWWKGDDAGYRAKHTYVNKHFPKQGKCEHCEEIKPTDYALIKGREYSRDRSDYLEL